MADARRRPAERLEQYLLVPALVAAAVLAIVGVFWVRKPYMVSRISCNFFSIGFQASGVFSIGICAGGVLYAISRTFLRDYFQYKIAHATFSPQYIADHPGEIQETPYLFRS